MEIRLVRSHVAPWWLETVEWGVVGTLVAIAAILGFTALGQNTAASMTNIVNTIVPGGGTGTGS